jgi:quinol monooxygenase YgiN
MRITEIALLRMLPGINADDANLRTNLAQAKRVMEKYTGNTFYYFQQTEDPSFIYIIGEWESLDQHMNHFIPSADNQAMLNLLKDQVTVEWLLHADVPHAELPLPKTKAEMAEAHKGETVFSVGRHFVKEGQKEDFQRTFDANKGYLQDFITEGKLGGGWRVDKVDGKEEWVLICPFTSIEQHFDFATTEGFQKYVQINDHIDGAEIKHIKLLSFWQPMEVDAQLASHLHSSCCSHPIRTRVEHFEESLLIP